MNYVYVNSAVRTVQMGSDLNNESEIEVFVRKDGDNEILMQTTVSAKEFNFPIALSQYDENYIVQWRFMTEGQEVSVYTPVVVVTPILSFADIKKIIEPNDDIESVMKIESAVRYIIQAHCGQTFGKRKGSVMMRGNGEAYVKLPERLLELEDVNGITAVNNIIREDGWELRIPYVGTPTIRADWDGWHEDAWPTRNSSLLTRERRVGVFVGNREYVINGTWGYNFVPPAVQEAAKLLINDYACGESMYRDRFLTSMTSSDWRIQFHEGAFAQTGNVRADQLLSKYIANNGGVI